MHGPQQQQTDDGPVRSKQGTTHRNAVEFWQQTQPCSNGSTLDKECEAFIYAQCLIMAASAKDRKPRPVLNSAALRSRTQAAGNLESRAG
jgi:hypothetical protein